MLPEEVLRQDDLLLEVKKRTRIDTHTHTFTGRRVIVSFLRFQSPLILKLRLHFDRVRLR